VFVILISVCVAGALAALYRWATPRPAVLDPAPVRPPLAPSPAIRVLRSEAELMVAIDRATAAERRIADLVSRRAERYNSLRPADTEMRAFLNN
jgi:uncharacterized iron-regulated membrane protein